MNEFNSQTVEQPSALNEMNAMAKWMRIYFYILTVGCILYAAGSVINLLMGQALNGLISIILAGAYYLFYISYLRDAASAYKAYLKQPANADSLALAVHFQKQFFKAAVLQIPAVLFLVVVLFMLGSLIY